MNKIIYCFSGTGNSLYAAEKIKEIAEYDEIKNIANYRDADLITPEAEYIGIVSPLYAMGLPVNVHKFMKKLRPINAKYIFVIITRAGSPGRALFQIEKELKRNNKFISAAYYLKMPTNYPVLADVLPRKKADKILSSADKKLEKIGKEIKNEKLNNHGDNLILRAIFKIPYKMFSTHAWESDKKFFVTDKCTSCGLCEKVCPVDNITLENGKPVWHNKCEQCVSCLNYCPVKAIQASKKTEKRGRYHHPEINAEKLVNFKNEC